MGVFKGEVTDVPAGLVGRGRGIEDQAAKLFVTPAEVFRNQVNRGPSARF